MIVLCGEAGGTKVVRGPQTQEGHQDVETGIEFSLFNFVRSVCAPVYHMSYTVGIGILKRSLNQEVLAEKEEKIDFFASKNFVRFCSLHIHPLPFDFGISR